MSKPVSGQNVFQNQAGPIPLSQLDSNFTLLINAANDVATYANYFVDASGAANTLTVTVTAPLTFAYVTGIGLQVKLAFTNTISAVNINVNALGNKPIINNDGSALAVGQLIANSILELIYDGVSFRLQSPTGVTTGTGLFADGTVGAPSISFSADTDTGIYRPSGNNINFSTGGSVALQLDTAAAYFRDGAVGTPGITFISDIDTGLFRAGANDLRFSIGGVQSLTMNSTTIALAPGGTTTIASTAAVTDLNVGQFRVPDGSAALPTLTFFNDPDTGFYRDTANQIAIALAGVTAGQIAQGSFTLTGTGFTAGVTATARYQRIGNHVMMQVDAFSGTSNATTFTGTGVPAIIQAATATGPLAIAACADNSGIINDCSALISAGSGTITFQRATGAAGWTSANTKGWALGFTLSWKI